MKTRLWLSALIPPALLALIFALQQFIDSVSVQPNGALWPGRVYFTLAGVGMIAGLAPLLCSLAEGRRGFRVNVGLLLTGIVLLSCSGWASASAYNLNVDSLYWVYASVCLALFPFGGALLTGSLNLGGPGRKVFYFWWKQAALILLAAFVAYASYAAMNLLYHVMPYRIIALIILI